MATHQLALVTSSGRHSNAGTLHRVPATTVTSAETVTSDHVNSDPVTFDLGQLASLTMVCRRHCCLGNISKQIDIIIQTP